MKLALLYLNTAIYLIAQVTLYLGLLHFVFTYSQVHAIILLISFISMEVSRYIVTSRVKQIKVNRPYN